MLPESDEVVQEKLERLAMAVGKFMASLQEAMEIISEASQEFIEEVERI